VIIQAVSSLVVIAVFATAMALRLNTGALARRVAVFVGVIAATPFFTDHALAAPGRVRT
jgi:hypothetical protein